MENEVYLEKTPTRICYEYLPYFILEPFKPLHLKVQFIGKTSGMIFRSHSGFRRFSNAR
jgi:hypothetical protein